MLELSFSALLLLLGAGVVLIVLEVFLTPGLGVKGALGVACVLGAVVLAFMQHGVAKGSALLVAAIAVLTVLGYVAKRTVGKKLVLAESLRHDPLLEVELEGLIGRTGVAQSPLRPAGVAVFGDIRLDVTAEPDFIEPGSAVTVTSVQGNVVRVHRAI